MRRHVLPAVATFFVAASFLPSVSAQPRSGPTLLVVNQTDHSLSLIDPATHRQIAAIDEGAVTGHEVAILPGGHIAYVPIYGDAGVGRAGTDGRKLVAIDLDSRTISGTLDFGHGVRPHCIVFNPHDGLLYITTELDQAITLVDPKTLKVVGSIPTGQAQSHMLVLSHDGRFGYTANVGPGTVSVLDLKARKTLGVIPVATPTQRIAISTDDRFVFTADQTMPRLAAIDTTTRTVKQWIPLPAIGYGTAPTADGHWLLVAMRPLNQVAVVDLHSMTVVKTIDVPKTPTEILLAPDGHTAYVSCGEKVAAIDIPTWKVSAMIQAGKGADGLAWAR